MKQLFYNLWDFLERISARKTDSPEERRREITLVLITVLSCLTGLFSGSRSLITNKSYAEIILPFTFSTFSGFALVIYYLTKKITILLYSFLFLILFIPVILQWSIGGITSHSSVPIIVWAILAPFGSLMFQNIRYALYWFIAYLGLYIFTLYFDEYFMRFAGPAVHSELIVGHAISIIALSITVFVTMMYFINAFNREHARAENLVIDLQDSNSELESTLDTLKRTQSDLVQSEKMASLGQLTAGIAHEINNPVGAIVSANDTLSRCIDKIEESIESNDTMEEFKEGKFQKVLSALKANVGVIDKAGGRVVHMVKSLKNFAKLDEADYQKVDIREGIDSSLVLINNQLSGRIEVIKKYNDIPEIACFPSLLNQVFMNLLRNAVQAIEGPGTIRIETSGINDEICVSFSDDGKGIPKEKLDKIFDFGFSTDQSKAKMGFGLATAYNIIQKHHGRIDVDSEVGKGTTFSIYLPVS